jgi:phosphoadenosine phosphosulfate reductase
MYSYEWDIETGGYLLNSTPLKFSKEPRPVYCLELNLLGFNHYWTYSNDENLPIMWAEANNYWYRGRKIGMTHGGSLFTTPKIEVLESHPEGKGVSLFNVDVNAMVEKNAEIMESLVNATIKRVYNTYQSFKKKVDVFHVSFSGGKDSIVLLDIVQRALPHNAFIVVFGDTQMEFPDTYAVVDEIESWCKSEGIKFLRSRSHLEVIDSWRTFGPPSSVLRWCCSVHKTAPQLLALRNYISKEHIRDMAFVGVRADESLSRSEYEYTSLSKKHSSQYSTHPILYWNSAEVYLYMYTRDLFMNKAYKKGSNRVGCLICPMARNKSEYIRRALYPDDTLKFIDCIEESYGLDKGSRKSIENLNVGGWKQRKNGKMLVDCQEVFSEQLLKDNVLFHISNPKTDWKVWAKTVGVLRETSFGEYAITQNVETILFTVTPTQSGYEVKIPLVVSRANRTFAKLFRQIFKKAAACIKCGECIANCQNGCIKMTPSIFQINNCIGCHECHNIPDGCLLYHSVNIPIGGSGMNLSKSIDCYSSHGPKKEWVAEYFRYKSDFFQKNGLGSVQVPFFKRFLRDSGLIGDTQFSKTAEAVYRAGFENEAGLGIMLANLSYTPQIRWYIKNVEVGVSYTRAEFVQHLCKYGLSENSAPKTTGGFERLVSLFETVGFGHVTKKGRFIDTFTRGTWSTPDPRVILYALYRFSEACDGYYQFTLARLMDFSIDSPGISPAQIFGIDEAALALILRGLSVQYTDFLSFSETLGLQTIDLRKTKTAADVLELF